MYPLASWRIIPVFTYHNTTRSYLDRSMNMAPNKELSPATRNKIIGAHECRVPLGEISVNLGISEHTVKKTWQKRTRRLHSQQSMPRSGRPRKMSVEDVNRFYRRCRRDPSALWSELERDMPNQRRQLRSRLKEIDPKFKKWVVKKRWALTKHHAKLRRRHARKHLGDP